MMKNTNRNDLFWRDGPVKFLTWINDSTERGEGDEGCSGFGLSWEDTEVLAEEQVKTSRHPRRLLFVF